MRDRELDERVRQVLADLAALSEVPAAATTRSSRDADDALPRGVNPSLKANPTDRPPPRDRSLYDFYAWHFERATADAHRRVLLFMAEGDLKARRWKAPEGKLALAGAASEQGDKRDERIHSLYVGMHPLEAALLESHHGGYCSEENVRAVRRRRRADEATGHPLPGWRGWTDEERTKRSRHLRDQGGKSLAAIAAELGTTKASVNRYLTGYRRQAA